MLKKPMIMGGVMGAMMLGMLHMALTGETTLGGVALAAFVLAHVAVLVLFFTLGFFAARLSPRLRERLARVHRPDWTHVLSMLASATVVAGLAHLLIHGGL